MKKAVIGIIVLLTFMSAVPVVNAAQITGTTSIGDVAFSVSKNVTLSVLSQAQAYTAHSKHLNGNKEYCACGGAGVTNCQKVGSTTANAGDTVSDPSSATAGCGSYQ